jgi:hypothetical protein
MSLLDEELSRLDRGSLTEVNTVLEEAGFGENVRLPVTTTSGTAEPPPEPSGGAAQPTPASASGGEDLYFFEEPEVNQADSWNWTSPEKIRDDYHRDNSSDDDEEDASFLGEVTRTDTPMAVPPFFPHPTHTHTPLFADLERVPAR